jgi:hypothetical protein
MPQSLLVMQQQVKLKQQHVQHAMVLTVLQQSQHTQALLAKTKLTLFLQCKLIRTTNVPVVWLRS